MEWNTTGAPFKRRAKTPRRANIGNGEFISAKAEEVFSDLFNRFPAGETAVILDPPRKGCQPEMLQRLREMAPAQIIYVSCHPATMARDLNVLCDGGVFELAHVQPLDMFPQTQHTECVADLRAAQSLAKTEKLDSNGAINAHGKTN